MTTVRIDIWSDLHCPWSGELVRLGHTDPDEPGRLLLAQVGAA
jgi:hypothetical protein